jgi:hypothetical protein
MSKIIQLNSCPNPKCEKKFENLIIVHDSSHMPSDSYYACPYCLMKLDPIATQILKKDEISIEEKVEKKTEIANTHPEKESIEEKVEKKTEIANTHPEKEIPKGCPQYFGYLYVRPRDDIIPQECLMCQKILDCTLKNENVDKQSK